MIIVFNTATSGISHYDNDWVDIVSYDNVLYALKETEIVEEDDTMPFFGSSYVTTGKMNLVPGNNYNVHPAYVTCRSNVELTFSTIVSEYGKENTYEYEVTQLNDTDEEAERYVPLSRKVDGNYWQFKLSQDLGSWNTTGVSLNIERIRMPKR